MSWFSTSLLSIRRDELAVEIRSARKARDAHPPQSTEAGFYRFKAKCGKTKALFLHRLPRHV